MTYLKLRLVLLDALILIVVPIFALLLRFEGMLPRLYFAELKAFLPCVVLVGLLIFSLFGLYRRMWRYARIRDMLAIVAAVTVTTAVLFCITTFLTLVFPLSLFILSWMMGICAVGAVRLAYKINWENILGSSNTRKNILIVGAGDAGSMLVREIEQNDAANIHIVGFLDDDATKTNRVLAGVPVLGTTRDLSDIVADQSIDDIVIAIPSADGEEIRRIVNLCQKTNCHVKIMPGIYEMVNDTVGMGAMRDIQLEDLLRREPIHLDFARITGYISGKTVLITGAGGSIGSELSRQISRVGARQIILLGRGENSIYEIHQELKKRFPEQDYRTVIANITDRERMDEVFAAYHPQVIFHAAAHKHVPLMEIQPDEAVRNNVFGTKNVADLADQYHSEIFVMISTDKAVNPTSVMGATKRACELVLQEINARSQTKFVTTRFGNVLGSRGSVVPLFEKQIAAGGPVTVTDPEMVRYFMTIPEAVQLVLQAGSQAEGGEVFLFDMGKPVKIKDMAEDLIRLHGLVPGKDIKIIYTGLRPGEKLYEEMLTSEEGTTKTKHQKIYKAKIQPLDEQDLEDSLQTLARTRDRKTILETLQQMIPTYRSKQLDQIEAMSK